MIGEKKMSIRKKLICLFLSLFIMLSFSGIVSAGSEGESAKEIKTGTITGRVIIKGVGPLTGGQVMLYDASTGPPPMPDKYERVPDISRDLDGDGRFKVDLPPGKYYLGAVKRLSGERIGAPQAGDYVLRSVDEKNRPKEYLIKAGTVLDAGNELEAAPLRAKDASSQVVTTAIEGVVLDMDGKPVDNAVVIAFVTPDLRGKPLFVSDKTGKDGKYTLKVTQGTYYLRVRNSFTSGPPEPGQIVGYYGDGTPVPVAVKEGEIKKGFDFRVILFPGRGPFSGTAPQKQ
jgi:hypothetical protein